MSRTTILQLTLALILSLVAGALIFLWMSGQSARQAKASKQDTVLLAVAATELRKGERITAQKLRMAEFLITSIPGGAFTDIAKTEGRVLLTDLAEGETITESRLLSAEIQSGGVSTLIAPGKRAVGVKGNKVLGLAGFVRPGNRVDVLVTIDDNSGNREKAVTKLVLENIHVLATGTQLEQGGPDDETSEVDTYTLELDPAEAERLALAATRGTLHFALRNPADQETVRTSGTDIPRTLAALKPKTKTPTGRPMRHSRVEVIHGNERTTLRFQ
ncbi:pilus assembly protein CpaB [Desulfobaculum xiamenense]|uniref:Pilus assembly protein CpaB n=1 Tax=Desulfobaculum xiamenense TaxID=995050 RepID=A0A846QPV9_9BACT|nr:Flp pilus assembly protein CpaB [Desulfobaculum xiamenense]NJB67254.1 pilus assembly protein CpaB [Desulfobaculum xiamenense]